MNPSTIADILLYGMVFFGIVISFLGVLLVIDSVSRGDY